MDRYFDRYIARYLDRHIDRYIERYLDRHIDRYVDHYIDRGIERYAGCGAGYTQCYLDRRARAADRQPVRERPLDGRAAHLRGRGAR